MWRFRLSMISEICSVTADTVQALAAPCKRMVHLQHLALSLADDFVYAQAMSYKYSAGLKLIAERYAKAAGGTFAKAWRPKDAGAVFTKLYLRRGNAQHGWLSDALQASSAHALTLLVVYSAAFTLWMLALSLLSRLVCRMSTTSDTCSLIWHA